MCAQLRDRFGCDVDGAALSHNLFFARLCSQTERQRMLEEGRTRNVNVLWLLTLTAPESAWSRVEGTLEGVAASFRVPLNPQTG